MNEATRNQRIAKAIEALPADHETLRVPWRGKQVRMPVVRIAIDSTVLNPRSHRIKSQLESDLSASQAIAKDPESDEAQEAIRNLLRNTQGYGSLLQNLSDEGQKDPGIVTSTGRLINANTRAVALGDLGLEYIEVAVLPQDAEIGELYDLELDLQVAQDYRQDYSFTNELLFVEDLITEQGRDEKEVAVRLRWGTPTKPASMTSAVAKVRRYVRHLDLIRDIQKMSGEKVVLTDFDDAEQALQEFDTAYESVRDKDVIAAQRLRQARILGLLVDLGYERQRSVDAVWVEEYFEEAVQEQEDLNDIVNLLLDVEASAEEDNVDDLGLGDFESADDTSVAEPRGHRIVGALVAALAMSASDDTIVVPGVDGEKVFDREMVRTAVNEAMRAAAEDSKASAKAGSDLKLPAHLLQEAAKRISKARLAHSRVASHDAFDDEGFVEQVGQISRAIEALTLHLSPKE